MKNILLLLFISFSISIFGQVGIGTTTPNPNFALDVKGNVKLSKELTLENTGGFSTINNQKFLAIKKDGTIAKYDISKSKYGPINYTEFIFNDLNYKGLKDFNTKIPTGKYILSVQGYSFKESVGAPFYERVYFNRNSGPDVVNGLVARAYKKKGTWWLQFYVNDSNFYYHYTGKVNVNLRLSVVIYRENLLTDSGNTITIDMNNTYTATATKPIGY